MELSYQQIKDLIHKQLPTEAWIVDLYDDHAIYEAGDGKAYQISYAIVDGDLSFGEKTEVEKKYVRVQASMRISAAEQKDSNDYGFKWQVRVLEFGTDKNKIHWTKAPLVAALEQFEGARVFMLSEAQHQSSRHLYGKPTTEIVGWLSGVEVDDKGIFGDLNILKSASSLRETLVDSWERDNPGLLGLSVDLNGTAKNKMVNGEKVKYVYKVKDVSVDIVYAPAAGGSFLRMTAAQKQEEAGKMLERLLAALKEKKPEVYKSIETKVDDGSITEDEVIGLLAATKVGLDKDDIGKIVKDQLATVVEDLKAAIKNIPPDDDDDILTASKKVLETARIVACKSILTDELREAELPEVARTRLREHYEGQEFKTEDLRAAITNEKTYLDKVTGSGVVASSGGARITVDQHDKAIQMVDDFFSGDVMSFKAAYINLTGDELVTGDLRQAQRLRASISTDTFAEILGDSIRRRMVKDYNTSGMQDWRKIADIVPLNDFRTNHRTRMGGYGDLPIVAQGGAYTALGTPGDEEGTYAPAKRGGTEDITLEAIKGDDAGMIRKIPMKLSRAAARTLYKFIFNFLATNPTIYDSVALLHTSHGNLGSAALDATNLNLRRQAILAQSEGDSSEVLGIPAKYLIVPTALDKTAYDLIAAPRNSDFDPTVPDFTRTLQMETIVVPQWADANNWFLAADKQDIPGIEIGFLDGKEDPDIFIQDAPNAGSMFSNDKVTYKIRHIYGGILLDYRGFDGSIVA